MTLKPEPKEKRNIQSFKTYQFKLPKGKVDIVISGLGFVTMNCPDAIIEVKAPENVGVFNKRSINIKEIRNVNRKTKKIFKT